MKGQFHKVQRAEHSFTISFRIGRTRASLTAEEHRALEMRLAVIEECDGAGSCSSWQRTQRSRRSHNG
jgi:hypothetical protein